MLQYCAGVRRVARARRDQEVEVGPDRGRAADMGGVAVAVVGPDPLLAQVDVQHRGLVPPRVFVAVAVMDLPRTRGTSFVWCYDVGMLVVCWWYVGGVGGVGVGGI